MFCIVYCLNINIVTYLYKQIWFTIVKFLFLDMNKIEKYFILLFKELRIYISLLLVSYLKKNKLESS